MPKTPAQYDQQRKVVSSVFLRGMASFVREGSVVMIAVRLSELSVNPVSCPASMRWPARRRFPYAAAAAAALLLIAAGPLAGQPRDRYTEEREKMVREYLVSEGIRNEAVLRAMRTVPRHLFCTAQYRAGAYFDQALPIGHKQTISPPFIVAYMTEMIDPQPDDRVLEIGTGSGYQAAILSGLVKDVYTIEIVEALGRSAEKILRELKYDNVHTRIGDGYKGWPEAAPFDKIIVTCSPEDVPQPLVEQLREGGRMIIPLGDRYEQVFYLFEKKDGALEKKKLLPALFVPMTGISEDNRKVKPDGAHPELHNGGFELDSDGDGHPDGWHYQRMLTLETQDAPEGNQFVTFENHVPGRFAMALQGLAVDGTKVSSLQFSVRVRGRDLHNGRNRDDRPALVVQFYDADRKPMEPATVVSDWRGTFDWRRVSKPVHVPSGAREAIVRVGLNGGTGVLSVDDIQLKSFSR